jgi:hypothetical protein
MNRYYNAGLNATTLSLIRSQQLNGQFASVAQGFDALQTDFDATTAEVVAARQGQVSLSANLGRYLMPAVGLTSPLAANNYRITGLAAPTQSSDAATKGYADALAFASALPAQSGNSGLEVTTDGTTASWGLSGPGALAVLNFIGY